MHNGTQSRIKHLLGVNGLTANGEGSAVPKNGRDFFVQADLTGSGAISATITIYGSIDGDTWCQTPLLVISLAGTDTDTDGGEIAASCSYIKAVVTGLSGTSAVVKARVVS